MPRGAGRKTRIRRRERFYALQPVGFVLRVIGAMDGEAHMAVAIGAHHIHRQQHHVGAGDGLQR